MSSDDLQQELRFWISVVDYHLVQENNNRCWYDDLRLYAGLPEGGGTVDCGQFDDLTHMERCVNFYKHRSA